MYSLPSFSMIMRNSPQCTDLNHIVKPRLSGWYKIWYNLRFSAPTHKLFTKYVTTPITLVSSSASPSIIPPSVMNRPAPTVANTFWPDTSSKTTFPIFARRPGICCGGWKGHIYLLAADNRVRDINPQLSHSFPRRVYSVLEVLGKKLITESGVVCAVNVR